MHTPPPESVEAFWSQGYAILPQMLRDADLRMLGQVCDTLLAEPPDDDLGGTAHNIGKGQARRFLRHRHGDFPELRAFVLGAHMKAILQPFLGPTPYLFNEQFVVKGPNSGSAFGWHQDGGYVGFDHAPYLSVWIAIDDVTDQNGPVYLLPRDLRTDTTIDPHHWDDTAKEMVGYDGPDQGVAAIVPAGTGVVFSSLTQHRSSRNASDRPRRAYLAQYSATPLIDPSTGVPKRFATPL